MPETLVDKKQPKKLTRRGSLISKEDMARMKMVSF